MYARFWWGSLRGKDHLKKPDIHGKIILIQMFRTCDGGGRGGLGGMD